MRLRLCWALWIGAATLGCKDKPAAGGATSAPSGSASAPLVKASPPACRAIQVQGDVKSAAGPVAVLTPLDGRSWVTLGEGAELAVRHGVSAREFELRGPGRFLPCRGGLEQVLASEGRVKSVPGTGVRPGGEFLIATPLGSVSYGDAQLELSVGASSLELELGRGELVTELAPGTSGFPAAGLKAKGGAKLQGSVEPDKLMAGCESAAKDAIEAASRVLSASEKSAMGKAAADQLVVRRRARAVCAIAASGIEREPEPTRKSALEQRLVAAERAWRTVPVR